MSTGAILVHIVMFITGTLTIAILYGRVRASDRAFQGEEVDSDLLDPGFSLLALIILGLPAIVCGTYLHYHGFDKSGLLIAPRMVIYVFMQKMWTGV